MYVRIGLRDLLRDAVAGLGREFPGYMITGFTEILDPSIPSEPAFLVGDCYDDYPLMWAFRLTRDTRSAECASQLEVLVNPLADIAFAAVDEDTYVQLILEAGPQGVCVGGKAAPAISGFVEYDLSYRAEPAEPAEP